MPAQKYSDDLKLEVLEAVDAGMSAAEAAKQFKIESANTVYTWTKKAGRKALEAARTAKINQQHSQHVAEKFGAVLPPVVAPKAAPRPSARLASYPKDPYKRLAELERENELLKKLVKAYRDMVGVEL